MPEKPNARLQSGNLFHDVPQGVPDELFTEIVSGPALRIERIVSTGHTTPEGDWCDQERHEWVLVLKGRARLGFDDESPDLEMGPGDHTLIPAHCRHRVLWTSEDEPTVWLAVHYDSANAPPDR